MKEKLTQILEDAKIRNDSNPDQEAVETPIDLLRASRKAFLRILIMSGAGFILFIFGQQTFTPILSFIGLTIYALPLVLSLCFGFSGIIDIGPVFRTIDTPIGNVIYRTVAPDISGQMAANLALTLIQAVLMYFLSVILMPLLLVICFIGYKIGRGKALKYAKENGIPTSEVPHIPGLVIPIYIGVLIVSIVCANLINDVISQKEHEEYSEYLSGISASVFEPFVQNIDSAVPAEYYAQSYKGDNYTGDFIAQFTVNGKMVKCGQTEIENVLESSGVYYIIDGVVYIGRYGYNSFTVCEDEAVIKTLTDRFPEAHFGKNMTLDDAMTEDNYYSEAMEGAVLYLQVTYNGARYRLHFDSENNLIGYGWHDVTLDMTETQFVFTNDAVSSSIKDAASAIINGTADISKN